MIWTVSGSTDIFVNDFSALQKDSKEFSFFCLHENIRKTGAHGLIIDVSGVEVMDSYISRAIRDIGLIAQLMGVRTVISP